jgi:hypothetical protein
MSEQRLAEITARAEAATPGPWCTDGWEIYQGAPEDVPNLLKWIGETCRPEDTEGAAADAAFVAAAREDVPALLAEIEQSRTAARAAAAIFRQIATRAEARQWPHPGMLRQAAADLDRIAGGGEGR